MRDCAVLLTDKRGVIYLARGALRYRPTVGHICNVYPPSHTIAERIHIDSMSIPLATSPTIGLASNTYILFNGQQNTNRSTRGE